MPVIRISDEVMDMLKKFAIPLEDTPDSVLRNILTDYQKLKDSTTTGRQNNSVQSPQLITGYLDEITKNEHLYKLPRCHEKYARWIISSLVFLGGRAKAGDVTNHIEKVFGEEFTNEEREDITSGEIRWFKNVHWARYEMVKVGLLNKPAHGVWELTEKGKTYYKD